MSFTAENSRWTEDRLNQLTLMIVTKGLSASQAADQFCAEGFIVTRNAVCGKMHRLHLKSLYHEKHGIAPRQPRKPREPRIRVPSTRVPTLAVDHYEPVIPFNAPEPLRTPLVELTSLQCHYVLDERDGGMPLYCGHAVTDGSWCAFHDRFVHYGRAA